MKHMLDAHNSEENRVAQSSSIVNLKMNFVQWKEFNTVGWILTVFIPQNDENRRIENKWQISKQLCTAKSASVYRIETAISYQFYLSIQSRCWCVNPDIDIHRNRVKNSDIILHTANVSIYK